MKYCLFFLVIGSLSLFGATKEQLIQVQRGLDRILSEVLPKTHVGVEVLSVTSGLKLYEKNAHLLFVPASSLQIFTAAAALHLLGPDFCFETQLLFDGSFEGNKLNGNLYLVGKGDPEFSVNDLEMLVHEVRLRGIQQIAGDLVIDSTAFDQNTKGPGWMWDDISSFGFSSVSPLTINHSCVNLWVRPGLRSTEAARLFVYPKTRQVKLINETETRSSLPSTVKVERLLMMEKPAIVVKGTIPMNGEVQAYRIPIDSPNLYAGEVLGRRLKQAGIIVEGKIRVGTASNTSKVLASHASRPLSMLVQTMLKYSDNLYSDHFFKKMGQRATGTPGSWANGGAAVRSFFEKEGIFDAAGLVMLDGSGLSRYNLVSPHQVIQLLAWMNQRSLYSAEFAAAFPISGGEGILQNRLESLGAHLRAQAGHMQGVRSLCGYITTESGERLALAILINGFVESQSDFYKEIEDRICSFLRNLGSKL